VQCASGLGGDHLPPDAARRRPPKAPHCHEARESGRGRARLCAARASDDCAARTCVELVECKFIVNHLLYRPGTGLRGEDQEAS
jgi:hypothetical protein